jgi:hypothetical protein
MWQVPFRVGSHGGQQQMGDPKTKAYIGYTSFFVALFSIVLFAPYDGWKLLLLFLAAIPFSIWVYAMVSDYESRDK